MKCTNNYFIIAGAFWVFFIHNNFTDVYAMNNYEHPDESSYHEIIMENIPIGNITVVDENRLETYFVIFWLYGIALKCLLIITGVIVFCFLFIIKGFYRLFRHGEI